MPTPTFRILIDGLCPLCVRESRFLQRLDAGRGRLQIIDITAPGFNAGGLGLTMNQVMGRIHGILPNGDIITGMAVFRSAYAAVGWGWLVAPTGWPGLRWVFDRLYDWFARNRLWLTGADKRACHDHCRIP